MLTPRILRRNPLTPALSPEYRGEGAGASLPFHPSRVRRGMGTQNEGFDQDIRNHEELFACAS